MEFASCGSHSRREITGASLNHRSRPRLQNGHNPRFCGLGQAETLGTVNSHHKPFGQHLLRLARAKKLALGDGHNERRLSDSVSLRR